MKLGVSYNCFSGMELLPFSIRAIKQEVDHVNVVIQTVANDFVTKKPNIYALVKEYQTMGLIDSIDVYEPQTSLNRKQNETTKRNIGLNRLRRFGCTHQMTMDTDEFYDIEQFKKAKKVAEKYDSTACQMFTYYKYPWVRLKEIEPYYVPFIYRIDQRHYGYHDFPLKADPSRRMYAGKLGVFKIDDLAMHHMSYIRKNIAEKLNTGSASVNFKNRINEIIEYYNNYKEGQPAYWGGREKRILDTVIVKPKFSLWFDASGSANL